MSETEGAIVPNIEREIGDHRYRAVQLTLQQWANLTEHLAGILGKPFADVLRGGGVDPAMLAQADVMMLALASVMERLTASNLLGLLAFAKSSLQWQSDAGAYNFRKIEQHHSHWQRNMGELAPAMALFLEAQYADFFAGLRRSMPTPSSDPEGLEESTPQKSPESQTGS